MPCGGPRQLGSPSGMDATKAARITVQCALARAPLVQGGQLNGPVRLALRRRGFGYF
jgi:hypothetical protein